MQNITHSNLWKKLVTRYILSKEVSLKELFAENKNRFEDFSIEFENILFDFSKNNIDEEILALLSLVAEKCQLRMWISKLFNGVSINHTEQRAVLHTALRNKNESPVLIGDRNVTLDISRVLAKMKEFSDNIHSGEYKGYTGKKIDTVVNIGIGGSHLGPEMVCRALKPFAVEGMKVHFVANIDVLNIMNVLSEIDVESTIFVIASKTFTTQETMENALTAKDYLIEKLGINAVSKHFIGVTSDIEKAEGFGIQADNIFEFWDWVGGRFSLWSSIGISIALYLGYDNFDRLLVGAFKIDEHFRKTPFIENIPVIMALLDVWYTNFYGTKMRAVIPYSHNLRLFPDYLQQLEMESNGKSIKRDGYTVDTNTGQVIFGGAGTNSQHSFFQLLHQGTQEIPVDFIAVCKNEDENERSRIHQDILVANMIAQSEAMLKGKSETEALTELEETPEVLESNPTLLYNKIFTGNKPSTTLMLKELNPETLGSLIAIYEHKVFVQGVIWDINSFDQWGVELGKELAKKIVGQFDTEDIVVNHDSSTNGLINCYKKWKH